MTTNVTFSRLKNIHLSWNFLVDSVINEDSKRIGHIGIKQKNSTQRNNLFLL